MKTDENLSQAHVKHHFPHQLPRNGQGLWTHRNAVVSSGGQQQRRQVQWQTHCREAKDQFPVGDATQGVAVDQDSGVKGPVGKMKPP